MSDRGHTVLVQSNAGEGSTIHDEEYEAQGAEIVSTASDVFAEAEMILKVKEPQPAEVAMFRPGTLLFTYLHLAAYPKLADGLREKGIVAVAYETVQMADRSLPLLAPDVGSGRPHGHAGGSLFPREGTRRQGSAARGRHRRRPGKVVVIGGGIAGTNAAAIAVGMQAEVVVLDRDLGRLRWLDSIYQGRLVTMASTRLTIEEEISDADLVIGTVLVPGASAPKLVTEEMVKGMRRGAVLVDVAIDQGGCFATAHETTHDNPVYMVHDVVHYAVGNIPGAVPQHLYLCPDECHPPIHGGARQPRRVGSDLALSRTSGRGQHRR